jgi:uncharacterized protein (TIGR03083 family)
VAPVNHRRDVRKATAVAALREQRQATLQRLAALDVADWDLPCLPGWQVRDVVAHLLAVDEATMTGRLVRPLLGATDRRAFERWNDEALLRWRGADPEMLLAGLARWGERVQRFVRTTPAVAGRLPIRGPFGSQPLLFLAYRRVLDEWVHNEDIAAVTTSVQGPVRTEHTAAVAESLADAVLGTLPMLSLPRVQRPVGAVRLVIDLVLPGGSPAQVPLAPRVWGVDFARHHYGPRVTTDPDATVRLSAAALALIAEDRVRWQDLAEPWITIEGDKALAEQLLDAVPPEPGD